MTAEHFVYAAERLCSPELNSFSANLLFDVTGCEELFHSAGDPAAADAAKAMFGVRAVDDRTLEYRFEPRAVLHRAGVELVCHPAAPGAGRGGGSRWWTNPATRIGNGPFRLVEYNADAADPRVRYARNEQYWGGRTKLDELELSSRWVRRRRRIGTARSTPSSRARRPFPRSKPTRS